MILPFVYLTAQQRGIFGTKNSLPVSVIWAPQPYPVWGKIIQMKPGTFLQTLLVVFIVIMMLACEGHEEKKMNAFNRGDAFYEKEKYVEAILEFKNAIQADPEFTEAYYKLGMAELKQGNNWV